MSLVDPLLIKLERRDRLADEEKEALSGLFSAPRAVRRGQDVVREGQRPHQSTLLIEGFCGRYNDLLDGRRQISALHVSGDFVDLHSFLLHRMDHGVVALSSCTVATIDHGDLTRLTERYPHLTRLLWLSTLMDSAINRRWIVAMGRLSSTAQLAHLLCELKMRLSVVGLADDSGFDLPLTQTELADVLGLSLVHVNRVTQELRKDGLIDWKGRRVNVLDWERLQSLAEFDPGYLHFEDEPR